MPKERLNDVIYLDITDSSSSFGLNFFECPEGADLSEVAKVASFVMHTFEKVWQVGPETPRLAQVLRNITRLLIENPGMTFAEIPLLLWEDGVREKLVRRVRNTQTGLFWQQYNRKSPRDRDELIASTINKCDAYLNEPLIARIVSQSASTIDFRQIMDEGKILLVNLSPQLEEASRLVGAVLLGRLLMAAFNRAATPEEKRRPFMIYCDEYQRFATADTSTLLAEARKFRISTNLFNQTLEQLDDANRAAVLQAGSLLVWRVSGEDSKYLAPSFDTTPSKTIVGEEPVRSIVADPASHLVRHGHPSQAVAQFVSEYLLPLDAFLRKVGTQTHDFIFGPTHLRTHHVIEGQRQLSELLATCMRQGNPNLQIPPLIIFVVGGVADQAIPQVFEYLITRSNGALAGFYKSASYFGWPGLHTDSEEEAYILKKYAKKKVWDNIITSTSHFIYPGAALLRFLKILRAAMEALSKEPIMTDTGLFQPKYQLRTYKDQENLVANELSQLPNFHAKVRLLTTEYTIRTNPPPPGVSDEEVKARIRAIKQQMVFFGLTKSGAAIDEEVRKRHEALRERPDEDNPPPRSTRTNRRR